MSVTERMFAELSKQGKTIASLCDYLELKSNVVANWKTSTAIPPAKYLLRISEFLNVTIDYLFTGKETAITKPELDDDSNELLNIYQDLDARGRTVVKAAAYTQQERMEYERNKIFKQEKGKLSCSQKDELRDSGIA